MSNSNDEGRFRVFFPSAVAQALVNEPRFHALLAFARAMNVIRTAMEVLSRDSDASLPEDRRRHAAAFFLVGGLLADIQIAGNRLGQWYRDLPAYAVLAEVWKGDPLGHPPLNALKSLRDTAVAHFSPEPYAAVLAVQTEIGELRWANGAGPASGKFYYEFADELALHFVLGAVADEGEFWTKYQRLSDALLDVLIPLHNAGGKLIATATRIEGAEAVAL